MTRLMDAVGPAGFGASGVINTPATLAFMVEIQSTNSTFANRTSQTKTQICKGAVFCRPSK